MGFSDTVVSERVVFVLVQRVSVFLQHGILDVLGEYYVFVRSLVGVSVPIL